MSKQIERDLPRTFPQHRAFASPTGLREALRRVLLTYASYNVSVGYCQSLNFIVAIFLLVADEEGAFWLLVALCRTVVADYHTRDMSGARRARVRRPCMQVLTTALSFPTGLRIDTAAFVTLVQEKLPSLYAHFVKLEVPLDLSEFL